MKPYYQSDDGAITVYHARWEDVHAAGLVPVDDVDLVHADPPYGIKLNTKARGKAPERNVIRLGGARKPPEPRSWAPVTGDAEPFNPAALVALDRPLVTWGANYYADQLPRSGSWLIWDKRADQPEIDNADAELAWSNLGGPVRRFTCLWRGLVRQGGEGGGSGGATPHLHPTQKPKALCTYVYQRAKLKPGNLVFVPYAGSLPDGPVCQAMGLRLIACDVERWCCDTAIGRLGVITPERAAEPVGPLFARPT